MLEVRTWEAELEAWLEPFLDALGHKTRGGWPRCGRVGRETPSGGGG